MSASDSELKCGEHFLNFCFEGKSFNFNDWVTRTLLERSPPFLIKLATILRFQQDTDNLHVSNFCNWNGSFSQPELATTSLRSYFWFSSSYGHFRNLEERPKCQRKKITQFNRKFRIKTLFLTLSCPPLLTQGRKVGNWSRPVTHALLLRWKFLCASPSSFQR